MKKTFLLVIFLIFLLLLAFIQAAQPQENDLLAKYRKIQAETKNSRLFRYDDGAPKSNYYTVEEDQFGYLWLATDAFRIYRFNGVAFTEMSASFPKAERDSLIKGSLFSDDDKTIHLIGRNYVYRWNGYRFIKYIFPKRDRIREYQCLNNRILAVGEKGYAVLKGDSWKYTVIPITHYGHRDEFSSFFISQFASLKNLISRYSEQEYALDSKDCLYQIHYDSVWNFLKAKHEAYLPDTDFNVTRYSKHGREILPCITKQLLKEHFYDKRKPFQPEFKLTQNKDLYLLCLGSPEFYYLDREKAKFVEASWIDGNLLETEGIAARDAFAYCRSDTLFLKIINQGSVFDADTKEYYYPGFVESKRYQVFHQDKVITISGSAIDWNQNSVLLRAIEGVSYLNPAATPETWDRLSLTRAGWIGFSEANKTISNTHKLYLLHSETNTLKKLEIVDEAEVLQILDYNPHSNCIMVAGKDGILVINHGTQISKVLSIPDVKYTSNFQLTFSAKGGFLLNFPSFDGDINWIYTIIQHHKGKIKKLGSFERIRGTTGSSGTDGYSIISLGNDKLLYEYKIDLESGKVHKTKLKEQTARYAYSYNETSLLELNNLGYVLRQPGQSDLKSDFSSIMAYYDKYLVPAKISSGLFQSVFSGILIDDDTIFIPPSSYPVITNNSGGQELSGIQSYYDKNPLPPLRTQLVGKQNKIFRTVSLLLDLRHHKYYERPQWIEPIILQRGDEEISKILYIDTKAKQKSLRISAYQDKNVIPKDYDFIYPLKENYLPNYRIFKDYDVFFVEVEDEVYYRYQDKWDKLSLEPFELLGELKNLKQIEQDLWLVYDDTLIRYSMARKESFQFTARDGLPEKMLAMYATDGAYYVVAADGIYRFSPQEEGATLVIPWIQANERRFSSGLLSRIKHNNNNLIIPVDILNTMFPERMKLSYRLLGYEKDWKQRDYTPQIEYPKLPPGRYEFQIYATSPTGLQAKPLSVFFIIKAPLYGTWWAFVIYILGLFFLGRYLYRLRIKQLQKRNASLEQTVALRTHELQERQRHIQESIDYASLIQKSILPQEADLAEAFKEHFVLWKPRATVGGDFYWLHRSENGVTWFALIDCTGHGVPGALLSMTVNSLLNHLIKDKQMGKPAEILQTMHREIGMALHQDRANTQQDGIEIALLRMQNQQLIFCGAGLHLLHYDPQTRSLQQIRGDKHGLGGLKWHSELVFTEHALACDPQLRIYLYTDGIIDQPLPTDDRMQRLGHPRWLELMQNLAQLTFPEQLDALEERLQVMLQYQEQRDDITIVGLQIG